MPIALAGSPNTVKTGPSNNLVTPAINTTGVDLIVCPIVGADALPYVTPIDNQSNTYSDIATGVGEIVRNSFAAARMGMAHVLAPTTNSSHTWTIAQPVTFLQAGIIPVCFSGVLSWGDQEFRLLSASGATTGTSFKIGATDLTPPSGGCLIITAFSPSQTENPGTVTPPSGFTLINSIGQSGGTYQMYVAYEIQEAAITRDITWTTSNAVRGIGIAKSFRPADGGPAGGGLPIQLVMPPSGIFLSNSRRSN